MSNFFRPDRGLTARVLVRTIMDGSTAVMRLALQCPAEFRRKSGSGLHLLGYITVYTMEYPKSIIYDDTFLGKKRYSGTRLQVNLCEKFIPALVLRFHPVEDDTAI